MQNGGFPWVSPSSLGVSQKSPWPGYQASLTDLFLKKTPLHQFSASGISQLAAASSYLEKMSTLTGAPSGSSSTSGSSPLPSYGGPPSSAASPSDVLITHSTHPHHSGSYSTQKCPHPDSKDKSYPCEICQQCSSICAATVKPSDIATNCSNRMTTNEPSDHKPSNMSGHVPVSPHLHSHPHPAHLHPPPPPPPGLPHHHQHHHHHQSHRRPSTSASGSSGSGVSSRPRNATNKQFLCPVCHKLFTQKGNLKTHMMIHTGDKPYACHICGKSFTQKGNVDTHMKIHTGEKDYGCDSCGKRFTQKGNLKTHVRSVHTKEKPFACGVCGKSFSQKGNMQTHIRTHNKDDRFPCSLCGKTFSQKGNLKTHMQRHAGTLPARRYGQRRQGGPSRLLQVHSSPGASSYSLSAQEPSPRDRSHMNRSSTDDDSPPPIEHSIASHSRSNQQQQHLASQHAAQHPHHHSMTPDEALSPQNLQLKFAHHASTSRDPIGVLASLQSSGQSQSQLHHRSPASSPISPDMSFGSCSAAAAAARVFSYPAPTTMNAPLAAHTSSWLAAASASNISGPMGHKNRSSNPYDAFPGFTNPYGSFVQASPLSRLSLLTSPTAHSGSEHLSHFHKQQQQQQQSQSSSEATGASSASHASSQHQFQTSTPNPDFSQLLE